MPGLDGFETTRALKADTGLRHVPKYADRAAIKRGPDQRDCTGASDFLTKPVDQEELILRVENNLRTQGVFRLDQDTTTRCWKEKSNNGQCELREALRLVSEANRETIMMLATASEYKDEQTGTHIRG